MAERKNTGQEKENNHTQIKAAGPDEQYLDLTSGKEPYDLTPRQETCNVCGLTARNKEELQDHINNAHADITDVK
jgi:DNA repair exonuclease SbcCD ATPase subunit